MKNVKEFGEHVDSARGWTQTASRTPSSEPSKNRFLSILNDRIIGS